MLKEVNIINNSTIKGARHYSGLEEAILKNI